MVGACLEAYANQRVCGTSNVFVRKIVQNSCALEFAKGKSPLLSMVPFSFNSTQVGSNQVLVNEAILKLLEKRAIEPI